MTRKQVVGFTGAGPAWPAAYVGFYSDSGATTAVTVYADQIVGTVLASGKTGSSPVRKLRADGSGSVPPASSGVTLWVDSAVTTLYARPETVTGVVVGGTAAVSVASFGPSGPADPVDPSSQLAPVQRGPWAATTSYTAGDIVITPAGDIAAAKTTHTSGVSYTAGNWAILVPAAGFPGRELASAVLATSITNLSGIGVISGLTDTTHDVNTAALDVSPVIGSRPVLVEAKVALFFGTTGGYGVRLYDKTAGTVLDQDDRATATAFQIQGPARLAALVSPSAGARQYGIKVNGTTGTNNLIIDGADNLCSSFIRVTER